MPLKSDRAARFAFFIMALGLAALAAAALLGRGPAPADATRISFTDFLGLESDIRAVVVRGDDIAGSTRSGRVFSTHVPSGAAVATRLAERGVSVTLVSPDPEPGSFAYVWYLLLGGWLVATLVYLRRIARALESGKPVRDSAVPVN